MKIEEINEKEAVAGIQLEKHKLIRNDLHF